MEKKREIIKKKKKKVGKKSAQYLISSHTLRSRLEIADTIANTKNRVLKRTRNGHGVHIATSLHRMEENYDDLFQKPLWNERMNNAGNFV